MSFCELHVHLYGCLTAEKLFEIGRNNPSPRWSIFTDLYEKVHGKHFDVLNFFDKYGDIQKFKELYFFNRRAPFIEFQSKFNLIIAFSVFDKNEISSVACDTLLEHFRQGIEHVEYRLMYSPRETKANYLEKTLAACEGLQKGEEKSGGKISGRMVVSLPRAGNYQENYHWLKEFMEQHNVIKKYLVGIDFCYIEEGFPPDEKRDFFQEVLKDNQAESSTTFSILYHVGESFADKTPFSAVRWILESAEYGAHRLGHCIALGVQPQNFFGKSIMETVSERTKQLRYELDHYESIREFGGYFSRSYLVSELDKLKHANPETQIEIKMDQQTINYLNTFQEFGMRHIQKFPSVIESCPTSNLYIGMIDDLPKHPLKRFVKNGLKVCVASDDPGIFDTTLQNEYELCKAIGLSENEIDRIKRNSFVYKSEYLSGRK
ncbi:MAG: adenosine deaminase [Leptospiraceae bacterium]|nr:adenosine deaminase [Leptospiraceae bacterium]